MTINYEKTHLAEDVQITLQELGVKINLKHYDLQRGKSRLNDALEAQDSSKIRLCLQDMLSTLNQIEAWEIEMEGCARLAKKVNARLEQEE